MQLSKKNRTVLKESDLYNLRSGSGSVPGFSSSAGSKQDLESVLSIGNETTKQIGFKNAAAQKVTLGLNASGELEASGPVSLKGQWTFDVDANGNLIVSGPLNGNTHFSGDVVAFSSATPPPSSWWDSIPVDGVTIHLNGSGLLEVIGGGGGSWGEIEGTLSDQTDLWAALQSKALSTHNHDSVYAPASHNHAGIYAPEVHGHNDLYYTEAEINSFLSGKQDTITFSVSGNRFDVVPYVDAAGVMEVGKYIDFHDSDNDTWDNAVRLESSGGSIHTPQSFWADNGLYVAGNLGLKATTVTHGTVETIGGYGGWPGYVTNGFNFMANGNTGGIYNNMDGQWVMYGNRNADTYLFHAGNIKLRTDSNGIEVTGKIITNTGGENARFKYGAGQAGYITGEKNGVNHWYMGAGSGGGDGVEFINYLSSSLNLGTAGLNRLTILGNGYVGVGTTNPLQNFVISDNGNEGIEVYLNQPDGVVGMQTYNRATAQYIPMQFFAEKYQFLQGDFGIGTQSPIAKLEVKDAGYTGSVLLRLSADDDTPYGLVIGNNSYGTGPYDGLKMYVSNGGDARIGVNVDKSIYLNSASLYVNSPIIGNSYLQVATTLGIGQTAGNDRGTGLCLYGGYQYPHTYGIQFMRTSTSGYGTHGSVTGDWSMYFNMDSSTGRGWLWRVNDVGNVASLSNNGDFTTNGEVTAYSDRRVKEDIESLDNIFETNRLMKIRPVSYKMIDDKKKLKKLGVVAQELAEIYPELVIDGDMLSVNYIKLIPSMIATIQLQQKQIKSLQKRWER